MTLQLTLIVGTWLVATLTFALLLLVWQRGDARRTPVLALLLLASALYAFGYGLELAGDSVEWVLATFRIQHLGIAFAPALLLLLAADVGRAPRLASRPVMLVALALSLTTVVLVYTNPLHGLYHANPRMVEAGPLTLMVFDRGPWYVVYHLYMAVALIVSNVTLLRAWARAPHGSAMRAQALLVAVATFLPWVGSLVYLLGVLPLPIDTSPYALVFFSVLVYVGVTRYGLADVSPIARALVFERMQDPAFVIDDDGRLVDHNEAAAALLRTVSSEPWLTRSLAALLGHDVTAAGAASTTDTIVDAEPIELAGRSYDARIAHVRGPSRTDALGSVVVLRDVSDHTRLQRMLTQLALTDELTGIANRRHLLELTERVLARAVRDGQPTAFVIFDLDRFKLVNDGYGHLVGDRLLRAVAKAVAANLRPTDLLGRYGGEEFGVCLPNTTGQAALRVAQRIREAVSATSVPSGSAGDRGGIGVTASVGVCAVARGVAADLEAVLTRADDAQYGAKRKGGDRVVVLHIETEGPGGVDAAG